MKLKELPIPNAAEYLGELLDLETEMEDVRNKSVAKSFLYEGYLIVGVSLAKTGEHIVLIPIEPDPWNNRNAVRINAYRYISDTGIIKGANRPKSDADTLLAGIDWVLYRSCKGGFDFADHKARAAREEAERLERERQEQEEQAIRAASIKLLTDGIEKRVKEARKIAISECEALWNCGGYNQAVRLLTVLNDRFHNYLYLIKNSPYEFLTIEGFVERDPDSKLPTMFLEFDRELKDIIRYHTQDEC